MFFARVKVSPQRVRDAVTLAHVRLSVLSSALPWAALTLPGNTLLYTV